MFLFTVVDDWQMCKIMMRNRTKNCYGLATKCHDCGHLMYKIIFPPAAYSLEAGFTNFRMSPKPGNKQCGFSSLLLCTILKKRSTTHISIAHTMDL